MGECGLEEMLGIVCISLAGNRSTHGKAHQAISASPACSICQVGKAQHLLQVSAHHTRSNGGRDRRPGGEISSPSSSLVRPKAGATSHALRNIVP